MADEGNVDTFEHTLSGRLMTFKKTSGGQLTMMRRYIQMLQLQMAAAEKANDAEKVGELVAKMHEVAWTAVESRFTSEDDLEFVRMEIIVGKLEETDLFAILSNGAFQSTLDDDAEPVTPKRAVKKATKKATRTANPRRASR
jgi:cation transport regulator ChaB